MRPGRSGFAALAACRNKFSNRKAARLRTLVQLWALARAEEIKELDSYLLFDVAPLGKPLSVFDLLVRAEHLIQQQAEANPEASFR